MNDLERFVVLYSSRSFKIGVHGERLMYPWRGSRGYVVRGDRTWKRLQLLDVLGGFPGLVPSACIGLILLALGPSPSVAQRTFAILVVVSLVSVLAVGLWARRLERSSEALTADDVRAVRRAVMNRRLIPTFAIGVLGFLATCGALMAKQFEVIEIALGLLVAGVVTLAYFVHRLLRRDPLPRSA
jgi:hypothetical protein